MLVYVKTLTGQTVKIDVESAAATVEQLKRKFMMCDRGKPSKVRAAPMSVLLDDVELELSLFANFATIADIKAAVARAMGVADPNAFDVHVLERESHDGDAAVVAPDTLPVLADAIVLGRLPLCHATRRHDDPQFVVSWAMGRAASVPENYSGPDEIAPGVTAYARVPDDDPSVVAVQASGSEPGEVGRDWAMFISPGAALGQYRFVFAGRQLEDDSTLSDCGVTSEATVHAVMRLGN